MTNINFLQYIELALRTEIKDYNLILERLNSITLRKLHGSYLYLEIDELEQAIIKNDEINIIEELGDCAWYIALLSDVFKIDLNFSGKITGTKDLTKIKQLSFDIADNIKKVIMYNKPLCEIKEFIEKIDEIYFLFNQEFGNLWQLGFEKNILKLQKRYGEKYSDIKANNRSIKAELEVIK
jgi:NTP pyrophosphatase (non-canonical NTP hydrolase)